MKVTRLKDAPRYDPPGHDQSVHTMRLQHRDLGCDAPYWVGCSYYLPEATAHWDASPLPKVYIVLDGQLTIAVEGDEAVLGPLDSVCLAGGENRQVRNDTNRVVTMLVVMPYPPEGS